MIEYIFFHSWIAIPIQSAFSLVSKFGFGRLLSDLVGFGRMVGLGRLFGRLFGRLSSAFIGYRV